MVILSKQDILRLVERGRLGVEPFDSNLVKENGIDLRMGKEIARFTGDPQQPYRKEQSSIFALRPHETILFATLEYIRLPEDLMAFIQLRSTFARLGCTIPPTVVDAGFEGCLTVQFRNGPLPLTLQSGTPVLHLILATLSRPTVPYKRPYAGKRGIVLPTYPP